MNFADPGAAAAPHPGTGNEHGYSTPFLADAAREVGAHVVTKDIANFKQAYAAERIAAAGLAGQVEFRLGAPFALTTADPGEFDFALLDIRKDLYLPCFEGFIRNWPTKA